MCLRKSITVRTEVSRYKGKSFKISRTLGRKNILKLVVVISFKFMFSGRRIKMAPALSITMLDTRR